MKTIFEHIEYVKGKPHHVRKQVAIAAAAAGSGLIGLIWLSTSLATGAFAIQGTDFAMSTAQGSVVATTSASGDSQLAGAAAAVSGANAPAHIEIVDAPSASKIQSEKTVLPF